MILNIEKSAKLYSLLSPFFPEIDETADVLQLSSTILENIINAGEHERYLHISMLITGKKFEELIMMNSEDFLLLFIQSMVENKILDLIDFYKVGFDGR